ncbi:3-phosphoshikimate 1-carboxyvinyltransferase, partial [Candidatus Bathyarchaeota archaeon]|nr:3-phosphoshikimate 1-carboxyvinyltransferase [Candidatus Bathyarchaeota archaeon]
MASVIIKPTKELSGEIAAPPSKSYTHRMLIAALLSRGRSRIENYLICDDTLATLQAIKSFGAKVRENGKIMEIYGVEQIKTPKKPINCRESGATLRFMIPIAALASGEIIFEMTPVLSRRPIEPLLDSLRELGVESQYRRGDLRIKIYGGGIKGGRTSL